MLATLAGSGEEQRHGRNGKGIAVIRRCVLLSPNQYRLSLASGSSTKDNTKLRCNILGSDRNVDHFSSMIRDLDKLVFGQICDELLQVRTQGDLVYFKLAQQSIEGVLNGVSCG
jgi:hypothetical protein